MYQDFYAFFMTDPFMNVLFDMVENEIDHMEHGKRLGLFVLHWWGDDDEYSEVRPGDPMKILGESHIRSKECPMRK